MQHGKALRLALLGLFLLLAGVGAHGRAPLLTTYHGDATGWNNAQKIVVDNSGTIHIVYQFSLTPAQEDLFIWARSADGHTWEAADYEGRWPAIGIDPEADVVYITFVRRKVEEDQLWLYQIDEGSLEERLIMSSAPRSLFYPAIVVKDSHIDLAWEVHRDRTSSIEYAEVDPSGELQIQIETVAESTRGLYFASLAVGPDGPQLVWEKEVDPVHHQIMHGRRGPSGWGIGPVSDAEINARYPALDYDPRRDSYELVFVGYSTGGNEIYYRVLSGGSWGRLQLLSRDLEPGYWTFPTVEDGNVVWGRTVSAGCSLGPLYYSFLTAGSWSTPQALEGEFAAFPHLFHEGSVLHLIWTDRDPESPIWRVIRYRQFQPP